MSDFVVPLSFHEHVGRELARLGEKNRVFGEQLDALRRQYGGGERLAGVLAALVESDEAFCRRVKGQPWEEHGARIEGRLLDALGRGGGEQGRDLELYWSEEHPEIHLRAAQSRSTPLWRRRALLTFDELFKDLMVPVASSAAYPIIFTHDVDENHRSISTSLVTGLVEAVIVHLLGRGAIEVPRLVFGYGATGAPSLHWEQGAIVSFEYIDALTPGFRRDRELLRLLEGYVDHDPQAHVQAYDARREDMGHRSSVEVVELVDPQGRALQLRLDRVEKRLAIRRREASDFVRKRKHVFVDPAPVGEDVLPEGGEEALEAAFRELLIERVEAGYRIVYEAQSGEGVSRQWGNPLDWH